MHNHGFAGKNFQFDRLFKKCLKSTFNFKVEKNWKSCVFNSHKLKKKVTIIRSSQLSKKSYSIGILVGIFSYNPDFSSREGWTEVPVNFQSLGCDQFYLSYITFRFRLKSLSQKEDLFFDARLHPCGESLSKFVMLVFSLTAFRQIFTINAPGTCIFEDK